MSWKILHTLDGKPWAVNTALWTVEANGRDDFFQSEGGCTLWNLSHTKGETVKESAAEVTGINTEEIPYWNVPWRSWK